MNDILGSLLEYNVINVLIICLWGKYSDGIIILVKILIIEDVYNEVIKWKKNVFFVFYGKIGKDFIEKLIEYINDWNRFLEM